MSIRCFYHSGDFDGACSGAIVKRLFPYAELHGINYGDDYKQKLSVITKDDIVYMVDFSLKPIKMMKEIQKRCAQFIWIDHHHDAIKMAEDEGFNPIGLRQDGTAACVLTWMFLNPGMPVPRAVELIGRWDVRNLNEDAITFQRGMGLYDHIPNLKIWKGLLDDKDEELKSAFEAGKVLRAFVKKNDLLDTFSKGFDLTLGDYLAFALNGYVDIDHAIETGRYIPNKHDFLMMFERRKDQWKFSLRTTREDVDVSEIARRFKGGGHKKAAGFETKDDNLITKMIKGKILITRDSK